MENNGMLSTDFITRAVGSLSCVVGLLCYALSPSFKCLFGEWNPTKIVLYAILSLAISIVVLFADKCSVSRGLMPMLKAHVEFLVLMLTSLYSFFADRSMKGKSDTWSVVSSGAFAFTSLCLSRQMELKFQVGLFNFFLGCLTLQLMKIHFIFILVAAGFCYALLVFRSHSESQSDVGDSIDQRETRIQIDNLNSATATQNEGISEQRSSIIGAHWLQSLFRSDPQVSSLRRLYGKAQNVWVRISKTVKGNEGSVSHGEGNRNEESGSRHENPKNSSKDELMAYYESTMTEMRRNHELQVQELNEEIRRIRSEALIRKRLISTQDYFAPGPWSPSTKAAKSLSTIDLVRNFQHI